MSSAYKSIFRDTSPMTTGFVLQLKAYFKIKKTVSLNNPARLIEKLFDCLTLNLGCLLFLKGL
jgi:hypothetical protein